MLCNYYTRIKNLRKLLKKYGVCDFIFEVKKKLMICTHTSYTYVQLYIIFE
jgi:hypothetical protein